MWIHTAVCVWVCPCLWTLIRRCCSSICNLLLIPWYLSLGRVSTPSMIVVRVGISSVKSVTPLRTLERPLEDSFQSCSSVCFRGFGSGNVLSLPWPAGRDIKFFMTWVDLTHSPQLLGVYLNFSVSFVMLVPETDEGWGWWVGLGWLQKLGARIIWQLYYGYQMHRPDCYPYTLQRFLSRTDFWATPIWPWFECSSLNEPHAPLSPLSVLQGPNWDFTCWPYAWGWLCNTPHLLFLSYLAHSLVFRH